MAKLAMFQMQHEGSVQGNLQKSLDAIAAAAQAGADLILFPEVQLTEFFAQYPGQSVKSYAINADSEIVTAFRQACRRWNIMASPNFYWEEAGVYYDASLLIGSDGELCGIQKMVHIAQAKQFYEQDYYTPADDGFHVFPTPFGNVGIVVCFDRHYPESIRTQALMGADLILIPTANVKTEPLEMFTWELRVQAFQNSVAIAMCNRVGREGNMDFAGASMLTDANGALVLKADDKEGLLFAEVDLAASASVRRQRPFTQLRRPAFYQ